ncbi:MAG: HDOD domain-containing protein [Nitrospira sp. CG24E]|nr:MAG: HDOD domain-containing protein [Nitrospira sp. CG24E]
MQTAPSVMNSEANSEIFALVPPSLRRLFDPQANALPALQATCQKILNMSGDTSSPEALAQVVSRDPGLTCKVLQIANGIAYSPQQTITSVAHAVIWLGLDTVRALVATAQLMEHLEQAPDRRPLLSRLIAKALFASTHAFELGTAMHYPQPGQLFSAALLYSFTDLVIAYQAPDLYELLVEARTPVDESNILGVSKVRFATALARTWVLPTGLVDLIGAPTPPMGTRWQTDHQIFVGLVAGANSLVSAMANSLKPDVAGRIRRTLQQGTALPERSLQEALTRAFDKGRQLSRSVGITETLIAQASAPTPTVTPVISSPKIQIPSPSQPSSQTVPPIQAQPFETLQRFQTSLLAAKDFNSLLSALVKALHDDGGFTRVALALLNPGDTDQLLGRVVVGVDEPTQHLCSFTGSLTVDHPLFLRVLKRHDPILVSDAAAEGPQSLHPTFAATWQTSSAVLAPIRVGNRPIGLLYCDRGAQSTQVSSHDLQSFQLFFGQAILSINRLAGIL